MTSANMPKLVRMRGERKVVVGRTVGVEINLADTPASAALHPAVMQCRKYLLCVMSLVFITSFFGDMLLSTIMTVDQYIYI